MIYFAPLQGFTDFVYRKTYAAIFPDIAAFFIPYISVKNNKIIHKQLKEILPENNLKINAIPQILVKDTQETAFLANKLLEYGYTEANLNLGCPYPMVTNRGKGAGLLPYPNTIRAFLDTWFQNYSISLSIKLRCGMDSPAEIENIISILNDYPLKEVILHPRTAKQLYSGNLHEDAVSFALQNLRHKLIFNGDIFSVADYKMRQQQFPQINDWMLGRGILMNPFLPAEIQGKITSESDRKEKLHKFHQQMLENYLAEMDNEGNAVNKMVQFWSYFSYNFNNQHKAFKLIKKCKKLTKLKEVSARLLTEL